jgi:hypothetical protein
MSSTYKSYLVNIHWKMLKNKLSRAGLGWGWDVVLGGCWLAGLTENKTKPFYQLGLGLRLANTCCVALYCWSSKINWTWAWQHSFQACFENWVHIQNIMYGKSLKVCEFFKNRKSISWKKDHQPFPLSYKERMNKFKFYTGCLLLLLFLNICLHKFPGQLH